MAIGIDPTVDFAFKMLLGNPKHPAVTIHFLNAVLAGSPRIAAVEILNPILGQDGDDDKLAILDIRARDDQGRLLNIEMQAATHAGLRQRLTYYVSSLYAGQMHSGDAYHALRPAISICVLDALLFPSVPDLHLDFRLRNGRHDLVLTDDLQVHFIELPKYDLQQHVLAEATLLEKWVYFFRNVSQLTAEEVVHRLQDSVFLEAAGVLEMIAQSPQERQMYEARLKFERDQIWRLKAAKDEGLERGELTGRIRVFQSLLGLPEASASELEALDIAQLTNLAAELRAQFQNRC